MAVRTYQMTPAAHEARRRNAQKSTGPRTAEGKRRVAENGHCAATPRPEQRVLPIPNLTGASEKLAVELAEAFEPANVAERLLVEELARLHARKRSNQEAQTGLILKSWGKLARERAEHQLELTLEHSDHPAPLAVAAGYITMEDSPAKFRQLSRMLTLLKEDVGVGNFSRGGEMLLKAIYGPCPSMRGAGILGNYQTLLESGSAQQPIASGAGPAFEAAEARSVPAPPPEDSEEVPATHRHGSDLEGVREALLRALQEEKSLLAAKYVAFLDEHIPSPETLERAAFVPADEAWRTLIHQDQSLDRQIERKTRLLLFMQWVRRREIKRTRLYRGRGKAKYLLENKGSV